MTEQSRLRDVFYDLAGSNSTLEQLEYAGTALVAQQKGVLWWLGDVARYAEARFPDTWQQVFPADVSPGLIDRAKAVAKAYPREEDRNPLATWSIHMQNASRPDRIQRVQAHVDAGRTTDEARQADKKESDNKRAWLLCVDVNYFLHRFWHSGAGVEAATGVASWIQRTVERLKEKGLTDLACCFDSHQNHRKELTKDWEDKYKDRPKKDPELAQQLNLVHELLEKAGFAAISVEGMEADDVMASYAKQFMGKVTLLTQDKDQRQCLSGKCNILLDVTWTQDEHSGDHLPEYKWLTAKTHTEETQIPPEQWVDYQCIMGDNVDGIRGVEGIGQKGAADLVKQFGTVEEAIDAAKNGYESIREKKREALVAFEAKLETTRKLVTLRDDLKVPESTRI
jgi:5'-3' exonuclease